MLSSFRSLDRLLRGDATRMDALRSGTIDVPIPGTVVLLSVLGMVYGACMGVFSLTLTDKSSNGAVGVQQMQIVASTVKVPLLFLLTLLVTFPSLYVFNALVGSRLRFVAVVKLMLGAMGVTMAVLASLGPIVGFFSVSSTSYPFVLLLNVAVFAVSGGLGMLFLLHTLNRLTVAQYDAFVMPPKPEPKREPTLEQTFGQTDVAEPQPVPVEPVRSPGAIDAIDGVAIVANVKRIFRVWIILFGVVGAQMAWVLRPFIGSPGKEFTWFRERGSSFFEAVWHALTTLLGATGGRGGGW
jgi:hypothetical protein